MALKYLHQAICHHNKSPSVCEFSTAMNFHSPRSGFRVLNKLMNRGFAYRDQQGDLQFSEAIRACDVKLAYSLQREKHGSGEKSLPQSAN